MDGMIAFNAVKTDSDGSDRGPGRGGESWREGALPSERSVVDAETGKLGRAKLTNSLRKESEYA